MPLLNTFGALRAQPYVIAANPGTSGNNWYSLIAFKNNSRATTGLIGIVNYKATIYGVQGTVNDFRPYGATITDTTGALSYYNVYDDITSSPFINTVTKYVCTDSLDNFYYFRSTFQINKYNPSNVFVSGTTILDNSSGNLGINGVIKCSTDDVYTVSFGSTNFILCKVNLTGLTVTWSKEVTGITINNSGSANVTQLYTDSSDNAYVVCFTSSGTVTTVFKFDSSGTLLWQTSTTAISALGNQCLAVDSSLNVYLFGTNGVLIKLDSSGTFQSARDIAFGAGSLDGMIINSDNNIVILGDIQAGSDNFTLTCVMSTSYSIVSTTQIGQGSLGSNNLMYPRNMTSVGGKTYLLSMMGEPGNPFVMAAVLKFPNDNTTYFSTSFTYAFTDDSSTTFTGSGTFEFTSYTNPTLTTSTYTMTTTSYSSSSYTTNSTTNSAPTLNSTTPYNLNNALV